MPTRNRILRNVVARDLHLQGYFGFAEICAPSPPLPASTFSSRLEGIGPSVNEARNENDLCIEDTGTNVVKRQSH